MVDFKSLLQALNSYRCSYSLNIYGEQIELARVLSHGDIDTGKQEVELLAEHLTRAINHNLRPGASHPMEGLHDD